MGIASWLLGIFGRKGKPAVAVDIPDLNFGNAEAALEYAFRFMDCRQVEGEHLPCIINSVRESASNGWMAMVSLPGDRDGKEHIAAISSNQSEDIEGRMCAVYVGPKISVGGFSCHVLMVVAVLNPTLTKKGWEIDRVLK